MDTHDSEPARAFLDLEALVGHEVPLVQYHSTLRRAAQSIRDVVEYGTCLVSCSDEFNGEVRTHFDRELARPLMSGLIVGRRRIFAQSNMGGRVEPGAIFLADQHFTVQSLKEGAKVLVVEIASHVGRRHEGHDTTYGELDRFGVRSSCCGALRLLLDNPDEARAVRFPWFDQLSAFFGPRRLDVLRADAGPTQMVAAAVVHAVLQAESALTDLLRDPPSTPTHVLLAPVLIINQAGVDGALPVGYHHLYSDGSEVHLQRGYALRSTPEALTIDLARGHLHVTMDEDYEVAEPELEEQERTPGLAALREQEPTVAEVLEQVREPKVRARIQRTREQVAAAKRDPRTWRLYARPLLRGLVQGLSVVAPELGIAVMLAEGGFDLARAKHLRTVLAGGVRGEEARRVLHDIEAELQQLPHEDAQQVLDLLLADKSPLLH